MDFVIASFALAEGPIAQDQALVEQQLLEAGFSGTTLAEARELTTLTERIVRSNMRDGLAEMDAFKPKYAGAAWLNAIQPRSYTGIFLKFSSDEIKTVGSCICLVQRTATTLLGGDAHGEMLIHRFFRCRRPGNRDGT